MFNGIHDGVIIEMLPRDASDASCIELPKLCTEPGVLHGSTTSLTYVCTETTATRVQSTVHVTSTTTTTVPPPPDSLTPPNA